MTEAQKDIDDVKYLHKFNNEPIFAKPITYNIDNMEVRGYVYYDPKLEQNGSRTFLEDCTISRRAAQGSLKKNSNPQVAFKKKARGFGNS